MVTHDDAPQELHAMRGGVSVGHAWRLLQDVADPEIPAVSIVDLGMVREVLWDEADPQTMIVRITPTYSGCPATDLIIQNVRRHLKAAGVPSVRVELTLATPWSTDCISEEGCRKLRAYGIAPPDSARPATGTTVPVDVAGISPLRRAQAIVPCPRCGAASTRLVAQFGSTACKAQYLCNECLEPFDFFKPLS